MASDSADKPDNPANSSPKREDAEPARDLAAAIKARMAPLGGVDLEIPPRGPMREPPDLSPE